MNIANLKNYLAILDNQFDINKHPFFSNLDKYDIGTVLAPFYFAVQNWPQHLLKIKEKIDDQEAADIIQENITDELSEPLHVDTYKQFLRAYHYDNMPSLTEPIIKFNTRLQTVLETKNLHYNLLLLGAIEYYYIAISTKFCEHSVKNNIVQLHYQEHEVLDIKHSDDLFKVAIIYNDRRGIEDMVPAVREGYQLLWNVYEDLIKY